MQPTLFPPGGAMVHGMSHALGLMGRVARQVSANATIEVSGGLEADIGSHGIRILDQQQAEIQCFEVRGCWKKGNPLVNAGASSGRFWVADAAPVSYWWYDTVQTKWDCKVKARSKIFYAVASPDDAHRWQHALYPLYGIGQWVWCIFDHQAGVWRVLHAYDDLVRFRLVEPMVGCSSAQAYALGYPCIRCRTVESISSLSASVSSGSKMSSSGGSGSGSSGTPSSASGCSGGFSHSLGASTSEESTSSVSSASESSSTSNSTTCLDQAFSRGKIRVYDPQGIVNLMFPGTCTAPACATGWAKRCADSQRWEVVNYGLCQCQQSSSGSSSTSSTSKSASASGSASTPASSSGVSGSGESSSSVSSSSLSGSSSLSVSVSSSKSTAIVPASWSPTGYAALFIHEMPEVRFDDVMVVYLHSPEVRVFIDPRFLEVCEPGSVEVCGVSTDSPVLIGAVVDDNRVRIRLQQPEGTVRAVIRLTGVRKGFRNLRFPDRTREQFEANEKFINSAYNE